MFIASCPCGITNYQKDKIVINWCKKTCSICNKKLMIVNKETNKLIYNFNEDHRSFFVSCPCKSIEFLEKKISLKWGSKVCESCNKRMVVYVVDVNTIDVELFYDFNKNHMKDDICLVHDVGLDKIQEENENLSNYLSLYPTIAPAPVLVAQCNDLSVLFSAFDEEPTSGLDIYNMYPNLSFSEIDQIIEEEAIIQDMYNDYVSNI